MGTWPASRACGARRRAARLPRACPAPTPLFLILAGRASPPQARNSAFRNAKTITECLAEEIINASKGSSNSFAIKKKDEIERVSKANR